MRSLFAWCLDIFHDGFSTTRPGPTDEQPEAIRTPFGYLTRDELDEMNLRLIGKAIHSDTGAIASRPSSTDGGGRASIRTLGRAPGM